MNSPIRLILKRVKTDSNGELIDAGYKTFDIESRELETLLFEPSPHIHGKFVVVGAELVNENVLLEEFREKQNFDF